MNNICVYIYYTHKFGGDITLFIHLINSYILNLSF